MTPPKPPSREGNVSLFRYLRLFGSDVLSAQPARLYKAWMAEFRTPIFHSFMCNDPALIKRVLRERPDDFPKSDRVAEGLRLLLGDRSVFLTNGAAWKQQRRIIDPAFAGGRIQKIYPAMYDAAEAAIARLGEGGADIEIEEQTSFVAADVIFRTLFSVPIEDKIASETFHEFRAFQRNSPLLNLGALAALPRWFPRLHRRKSLSSARRIRELIIEMTQARGRAIADGSAPDDLATKIMTTPDPETGDLFSDAEMVDQVAIFFLAGHETSASALAWGMYLMAIYPEWQDKVAREGATLTGQSFSEVSRLTTTRDVFRETLRLYPPVPMLVRETTQVEDMRAREAPIGAQVVISPWHLHRHTRLWDNPDGFDPARWQTPEGRESAQKAYIPFSSGPRVCTGASFAMAEGCLLLAKICAAFKITPVEGKVPEPIAHLTVRARHGIHLTLTPRKV